MRYDDPATRQAYIAGAREAVDAAIVNLLPPHANDLEQWMSDLECWVGGEPPPAPR